METAIYGHLLSITSNLGSVEGVVAVGRFLSSEFLTILESGTTQALGMKGG